MGNNMSENPRRPDRRTPLVAGDAWFCKLVQNLQYAWTLQECHHPYVDMTPERLKRIERQTWTRLAQQCLKENA